MGLWNGKKKSEAEAAGGDDFERAAEQVTARVDEEPPVPGAEESGEGESLVIRPEWADAASRLCFLPMARLAHPAYALNDDEAAAISPRMQAFLQAVADKYAPDALGRVANKYPEFFDLTAALGVLYWQKWRYVSKRRQMEAAERMERDGQSKSAEPAVDRPLKVGDRTKDGALVI